MIGEIVSHYEIIEKLGEGGMGIVYKAEDTRLKRTVALKFLPPAVSDSPAEKARFIHEAQSASAINHPNATTIYGIEEHPKGMFIAMEYVEGKTLRKVANEDSPSITRVLELAIQICDGLTAAHEKDVVHRDIKSDNIMVTPKGQVKIMDFGLAKLKGGTKLTSTGSTLGTIAYMSPEQTRGEQVDHRSDVFSLGVVLYELITKKMPFRGDHEAAIVYSITNETPEPLARYKSDVPEELQRIVSKALEKDVSTRYHSAGDMAADLRALRMKSLTATTTVPAESSSRPRRFATIVASLVLAAAAVVVALQLFPGSQEVDLFGHERSIGVLAFKNLSADQSNEYFSDGITEDIITQLSKIGDLRVISRTSTMLYKNSDKTMREIGDELDVATILEGSVRRAGNRVRIVGQLIDVQSDDHIWSETYDRDMEDIFAIQSDVARQIAVALRAELTPQEEQLLDKRQTKNLTAYDYYLKGREYYARYEKDNNENAIRLFKKAIELDPEYAAAYAGLADSYCQRELKFGYSYAWLDSAIAISDKAISIDPLCAEAYKSKGLAYIGKGWNTKALETTRKAVELKPSHGPAVANMGWTSMQMGDLDVALEWMKKAVAISPTYAYTQMGVAAVYSEFGDFDETRIWVNKALELQPDLGHAHGIMIEAGLDEGRMGLAMKHADILEEIGPADPGALTWAAVPYVHAGDFEAAVEKLERAAEIFHEHSTEPMPNFPATILAYVYLKTGRNEEAGELLNEAEEGARLSFERGVEVWGVAHSMAAIRSMQGKKEEAIEWLDKSVDMGWRNYKEATRNPLFENLHGDERFDDVISRAKAIVDEMRQRVEEVSVGK